MLNLLFKPEQSLLKSNVHVHVEVVADSSEDRMLVLLEYEDDVPLQHVRLLLSLLLEHYLITIFHASLHFDGELLALLDESLASAVFTVFRIDLTFSTTFLARLLHLHLHNPHVDCLHGHSSPLASGACLCFATFSSGSLAF